MSIRDTPAFPELVKFWKRMNKEYSSNDGVPQDPSLFNKVKLSSVAARVLGVADRNDYIARYFHGEKEFTPRVIAFGTAKQYDARLGNILRALADEDVLAIRLSGSKPVPQPLRALKWRGLGYGAALDYAVSKMISVDFNDSEALMVQERDITRKLDTNKNLLEHASPSMKLKLTQEMDDYGAELAKNRKESVDAKIKENARLVNNKTLLIQLLPARDLYVFSEAMGRTNIPYLGFGPLSATETPNN